MRFLIADDDRALGMLLLRSLEAEGHDARLAADGQSAVDCFLKQTPDLTILDLDLPRRDGFQVFRFLRSITFDSPILILTARSEIDMLVKCLDLGADDYMLKPFPMTELRARCRALLRRRRDPNLILRQRDLEVNRVERSVSRDGQPVSLYQQGVCPARIPVAQPRRGRLPLRAAGARVGYEGQQHKRG